MKASEFFPLLLLLDSLIFICSIIYNYQCCGSYSCSNYPKFGQWESLGANLYFLSSALKLNISLFSSTLIFSCTFLPRTMLARKFTKCLCSDEKNTVPIICSRSFKNMLNVMQIH